MSQLNFKRQPAPVLAEHRPMYKIGQVLMILYLASRGGKSSLVRLHLFNWALKNAGRSEALKAATKTKRLCVTAWGFDPALAIALRYAVAEELVKETSAAYELTDRGRTLAKEIAKAPDLFAADKIVLNAVGKSITEEMVYTVAKGWEM